MGNFELYWFYFYPPNRVTIDSGSRFRLQPHFWKTTGRKKVKLFKLIFY